MRYVYIALTLGLTLAVGLIAWQGLDTVLLVLAVGGWSLLLLGVYQILPIILAARGWRELLGAVRQRGLVGLTVINWIGLSVNWLLPAAQIGGDLLRARLLTQRGADGAAATATASVVVDNTIQAGFSLLGLAQLLAVVGTHELVGWIGGFVVLLTGGLWIFYRLQLKSPLGAMLRGLQRIPGGSRLRAVTTDGHAFDAVLDELYRQRARLVAAVLWRIAERLSKAGEVWRALWLIGMPVSVGEALILESLTQAVRAAAFLVPAGISVQEGDLVVIGAALGLGPDLSLALSLAKRFRELVVGLPGLLGWQIHEWRARKRGIETNRTA